MRKQVICTVVAALSATCAAEAQWATFSLDNSRLGPGVSVGDTQERTYAVGDVDHDGDLDVVVSRKVPYSRAGGFRGVLLMNENGVLNDRTSTLAVDSLGVPSNTNDSMGIFVAAGACQGMMDATNTRQVILVDVNNDGWLDVVTCTTISDVDNNGTAHMLARYLGHPRIYINKGSSGGVWQGFRYEYNRFPQMQTFAGTPVPTNPRFCSVAAGDLNGDGYVDLYFSDYDSGEVGPSEPSNHDLNQRLFINQGAANPGVFVDESQTRMTSTELNSFFGAHGLIADMNGDGIKDIITDKTLSSPIHIAVMTNPGTGVFTATTPNPYKQIYAGAPYGIAAADLNGDGKLDLVVADDGDDRYLINTGNDGVGQASFSNNTLIGNEIGNSFSARPVIADLNNDGWPDVMIMDQDLDTDYTSRSSRIYHNIAGVPTSETPAGIPASALVMVYHMAALDINGDGWKDLIIGRTGATDIYMNVPPAGLAFSYPSGKPSSVSPNTAVNFNVQLTGTGGGSPQAGSGKIYLSYNGGAFSPTSMTPLGGDLYQATIPATACNTDIRYYFSGQLTAGATVFTDPAPPIGSSTPASYYNAYATSSSSTLINEDFEGAAAGWSVSNDPSLTGGGWELATPVGTWNEGVKAAPDANHTAGGSKCYVTQNGSAGGALSAADVDGGPTHLISPLMDLSGSNATVSFAYWFYTSTAGDVLQVSVSNDNGSNWVNVAAFKVPAQPTFQNVGSPGTELEFAL